MEGTHPTAEEAEWVRILSEDGWSYLIPRKTAMYSGFLKRSLTSGFVEADANTCKLPYRAAVVEKVMEYLTFKGAYVNAGPKEELPDFATERLPPELALELLIASDFLEV